MKVIVRGKNKFEPSDAINDYAFKKLQKLDHFFNSKNELVANVLCKVYDNFDVVEITLPTKNILLRAEVKADDIYTAIDMAVDKIDSQIRRHKSKLYSSIKRRDGVALHYSNNSDFDLEQLNAEVKATNLVKSKEVILEPMTPDDAILQMEMLGHDFFLFLNSITGKPSVVYLREDQDYGIIETK